VSPRVTLNGGMRYDVQFFDDQANNVSPLVGVAWSRFSSRQRTWCAQAGLFYNRVPLRALANA
jgi:hypothetical protein